LQILDNIPVPLKLRNRAIL